eukprot:m.385452 g.385452  ORF g.385452 m.385452 type:complete len:68 (-) comp21009_c0_seq3:1828-2031(-)
MDRRMPFVGRVAANVLYVAFYQSNTFVGCFPQSFRPSDTGDNRELWWFHFGGAEDPGFKEALGYFDV